MEDPSGEEYSTVTSISRGKLYELHVYTQRWPLLLMKERGSQIALSWIYKKKELRYN